MSSEAESVSRGRKGSGSIRRTKCGNYEYRISYFDELHNRRTKSFTCATVDECVDKAEAFKKELEENMNVIRPGATISQILRHKAEVDLEKNHVGEQGYDRTLQTIGILERGGIGHRRIADIRPRQLENYLNSITHYSNTVIGKIYGLLRAAYRLAYDAKIIEFNYMLMPELRCPRSDKPDKKVRALTDEEQKILLETLEKHKTQYGRNDYRLQILIELYSGLRMGEINALKPEDIHLARGYMHVGSTVSRGLDYRPFIKDGAKTYAGTRDVPISRTLRPILEEALASAKPNPYGLLFYDYHKDSIIETSQVNSFFRRLTEKAGIPVKGQHALRHSFATRCIEAGVPAVVLKKWLGHTDIHITLDTYADVFARMDFSAIDRFDDLMDDMELGWYKTEANSPYKSV